MVPFRHRGKSVHARTCTVFRIWIDPSSSRSIVDVAIRFREFAGTYVEHCHNTTHEDKAMLLRWDNELPGQTVRIPTPLPTWDGVGYISATNPDPHTGELRFSSWPPSRPAMWLTSRGAAGPGWRHGAG